MRFGTLMVRIMVRIGNREYPMFIGLGTMVRIQRGTARHTPVFAALQRAKHPALRQSAALENPGYLSDLNQIKPN